MKNYTPNPTQKVVITFDKNQTLARIYEDNKVVAKGIAICSPEDEFDLKLGSELALTRALEAITPMIDPENVKWVKVDRQPVAGDYVRIVRPYHTFDRKGDVIKLCGFDPYILKVKAKDHANRDRECMIYGGEYVWYYAPEAVEVVEPVTKPQEWVKVDRAPRPGDHIRIILKDNKFDEIGDILEVNEANSVGVKVLISKHPKCENYLYEHGGWWPFEHWVYLNREFEVVEHAPEKPKFRKITRLPKVGDYVKILRSGRVYDSPKYMLKICEVVGTTDEVFGVSVFHKDHPGAREYEAYNGKPDNYKHHWNCGLNTLEFYEKVEDTIVVYNGKRFRKVDRDLRKGDYIKLAKPFFTFDTTEDFMKVDHVSEENGKTVPHVRHADNPGAVRDCEGKYYDNYIWNYWDFTGNVYECLDD